MFGDFLLALFFLRAAAHARRHSGDISGIRGRWARRGNLGIFLATVWDLGGLLGFCQGFSSGSKDAGER